MPKCGGREYCGRMPFCGCGGPTEAEIDEEALEKFTAAMREKLAVARAKGRHGWHNREVCSIEDLARMFFEHVEKGDLVDIANFAMFLHQREGRPKFWRLTHPDTWDKGSNYDKESDMNHTKEPWPEFSSVCVAASPDPNAEPVALLSWDDYIRARACVNACAGIPTENLENGCLTIEVYDQMCKQRDELLAAQAKVIHRLQMDIDDGCRPDQWSMESMVETLRNAAIAKVKP